ncbi:uncharacterized protein LOC144159706 isoform X2 [Haemaphysalis longicornis]
MAVVVRAATIVGAKRTLFLRAGLAARLATDASGAVLVVTIDRIGEGPPRDGIDAAASCGLLRSGACAWTGGGGACERRLQQHTAGGKLQPRIPFLQVAAPEEEVGPVHDQQRAQQRCTCGLLKRTRRPAIFRNLYMPSTD